MPSRGRSPRWCRRSCGWLGREDAPLLFRPRADWAQWSWALRFLLECRPGRFERHSRTLAGLAAYSRECLRALRAELGIRYDHLARGILQFATSERDFEAWRITPRPCARSACEREVKSAAEILALEPALRHSADPVVGGVYNAATTNRATPAVSPRSSHARRCARA